MTMHNLITGVRAGVCLENADNNAAFSCSVQMVWAEKKCAYWCLGVDRA